MKVCIVLLFALLAVGSAQPWFGSGRRHAHGGSRFGVSLGSGFFGGMGGNFGGNFGRFGGGGRRRGQQRQKRGQFRRCRPVDAACQELATADDAGALALAARAFAGRFGARCPERFNFSAPFFGVEGFDAEAVGNRCSDYAPEEGTAVAASSPVQILRNVCQAATAVEGSQEVRVCLLSRWSLRRLLRSQNVDDVSEINFDEVDLADFKLKPACFAVEGSAGEDEDEGADGDNDGEEGADEGADGADEGADGADEGEDGADDSADDGTEGDTSDADGADEAGTGGESDDNTDGGNDEDENDQDATTP